MLTATTTAPRYVDGAGSHVTRNVPSKRIKAAHRSYGGGMSLRTFARRISKSASGLSGFPEPDGVMMVAAKAWLAGKGL